MDINDARSILTLLCFVIFVAITLWAFSGSNKARFDEAAKLPFDDDEPPASRAGNATNRGTAS